MLCLLAMVFAFVWLKSRAGSGALKQKVSCKTEQERSQTMIRTVLTILTELPPDDAWAPAQASIPTRAQQNRRDLGVTAEETTQGHLVVTIGNGLVTHSTIAIGVRDQPVEGRTRVTFKATGYHAVNGACASVDPFDARSRSGSSPCVSSPTRWLAEATARRGWRRGQECVTFT
ncbi:MAG: hypothetical protein ACRDZ4_02685 [Egibacteraceae bacterium]